LADAGFTVFMIHVCCKARKRKRNVRLILMHARETKQPLCDGRGILLRRE
jgi:hypothetical protein